MIEVLKMVKGVKFIKVKGPMKAQPQGLDQKISRVARI